MGGSKHHHTLYFISIVGMSFRAYILTYRHIYFLVAEVTQFDY